MVDPLAAALITAGATAGLTMVSKTTEKAIEVAWERGQRWLGRYFADHSAEVTARANQNAAAFLADLAIRVEAMESEHAETLRQQLDTPDFAAIMETAFRSAARTSSEEKRAVLAGLVADRLLGAPDAEESVITNIAISAVQNLTDQHLLHLGCLTLLQIAEHDHPTEGESDIAEYSAWLERSLEPMKSVGVCMMVDALHLVSCQLAALALHTAIPMPTTPPKGWTPAHLSEEWSTWLSTRLDSPWSQLFLTPAGMVIGAQVCRAHGNIVDIFE